jgi:hypothetical protein
VGHSDFLPQPRGEAVRRALVLLSFTGWSMRSCGSDALSEGSYRIGVDAGLQMFCILAECEDEV